MFKKRRKVNKMVSIALALVILITAVVIKLPDGSSEVEAIGVPRIEFKGHIQNLGDRDGDYNNNNHISTVGTTGHSLRLEAIKVGFKNWDKGGSISVQAFTQYNVLKAAVGSNDNLSPYCGTTGDSTALYKVRLHLYGNIANSYTLKYRVHSQDVGWSDWYTDGFIGTDGKRIEAVQAKLVWDPK